MLLRLSKANIDVYCYKQTTFSQLFLFRIKLLGKVEKRSRGFLLEVRISLRGIGKTAQGHWLVPLVPSLCVRERTGESL